jgi:hypothetical protein
MRIRARSSALVENQTMINAWLMAWVKGCLPFLRETASSVPIDVMRRETFGEPFLRISEVPRPKMGDPDGNPKRSGLPVAAGAESG